jgi:hypothetical protein
MWTWANRGAVPADAALIGHLCYNGVPCYLTPFQAKLLGGSFAFALICGLVEGLFAWARQRAAEIELGSP